jgi:hypothetical protein
MRSLTPSFLLAGPDVQARIAIGSAVDRYKVSSSWTVLRIYMT